MKGTLVKRDTGDWVVWWIDLTSKNGARILPLHQDDAAGLFIQDTDSKNEGKEVEFEIFDNRERCDCVCHKDSGIVHFRACCNDGYKTDNLGHVNYYAKLVDKWITMKEGSITVNFKPMPEFDEPTYPTRAQQLHIQIAEECFKKYPNNEELYPTDELKDAYKAGVIDGFKEAQNYNPPTKKQKDE